jgi:hypothetical protein
MSQQAARTSETLVNFYQTTRRYNPEDGHRYLFRPVRRMRFEDHKDLKGGGHGLFQGVVRAIYLGVFTEGRP